MCDVCIGTSAGHDGQHRSREPDYGPEGLEEEEVVAPDLIRKFCHPEHVIPDAVYILARMIHINLLLEATFKLSSLLTRPSPPNAG